MEGGVRVTTITEPQPAKLARPAGPIRWCFEDRTTGRIVVAQFPNWPLWLFFAALLIEILVHPAGRLGLAVRIAKIAGLTIWAVDEIVRGVNPWRRALGAAALAYEAYILLA